MLAAVQLADVVGLVVEHQNDTAPHRRVPPAHGQQQLQAGCAAGTQQAAGGVYLEDIVWQGCQRSACTLGKAPNTAAGVCRVAAKACRIDN